MKRAWLLLPAVLLGLGLSAHHPSAHAAPDLPSPSGAIAVLTVSEVSGREVTLRMPVGQVRVDSQAGVDTAEAFVDGIAVPARVSLDNPGSGEAQPRPTVAVLALDASGSMEGERIEVARQAAASFVEDASADVSVGLVTFADEARLVQAPGQDRQSILDAIAQVRAGGDTALHDAISIAVSSVPAGADARIILLSDGADTSSALRLAEALQQARRKGAPIDVIAVQPTDDEQAILARIAEANDGRLLPATDADELASAFIAAGESFAAVATIMVSIPDQVNGRLAPIAASVRIGGLRTSGVTTLPDDPSLAAVVPVPSPAALVPAAEVPSGLDPTWLGLGAFVFLAILAAGIAWIIVDRRIRHRRRIEQLAPYQLADSSRRSSASTTAAGNPIDRMLERTNRARRMRAALGAAEIPLSPGNWLLLRIGISTVLAVGGMLLLGSVVGALAGLVIGWLTTWAVVRARSSRRQQSFAEQLPDFLLLIASGLRGGLSFNHALEAVAIDGKGEVPRQMRRVLRQVQVGSLLDEALLECAERMDSEDLRWTVTALSIQREVGGNLSTILDNAAATIKSREELRREVRTLSAEGRLSGYILIGLPLGVMLFLAIIRRSYVELLWTTALGVVMLAVMGMLMVLGWFWMRAIVRIKA
jgi:Flp pilus assembly protein TadB/uncharacterized protein YegL